MADLVVLLTVVVKGVGIRNGCGGCGCIDSDGYGGAIVDVDVVVVVKVVA